LAEQLTSAFGETVAGSASNKIIGTNLVAAGQTVVAHHFKPKKPEGYILARGILISPYPYKKGKGFLDNPA
jgi:1,4-dihydroxy-2-naphthoyl-CoA hydrolase